jgi:hypothetical protein
VGDGALISLALVLACPRLLAPLNGACPGPPIRLGIVFFALFVPLGILRRRLGGDTVARRFDPNIIQSQADPLALFPFHRHNHYTAEANALVARTLLAGIGR